MLITSCGDGSDKKPDPLTEPDEISLDDANNALGQGLLKLDREIFSLPSPVQTAILLKKNSVDYEESLVNPVSAEKRYVNRTQKSLNLGVYGADLAYLSSFNNTQLKLDFLKVIEKMATDMDIRSHIDQSLIDRFAQNLDVRDSLYTLNAEIFSAVDRYLKESGESHIAALILTGGWVEAMHLTLGSAITNLEIRGRVGEQASAARSLAKLIRKIDDPQLDELGQHLDRLVESFSDLNRKYEYVKPITDPSERMTYLNSKSSVEINDEQLAEIKRGISTVRSYIIQ